MVILKFDKVSKIFYSKTQQTTAIADLSFEINEGEFVAIIGPSGCGKTTILSLVCGLIEPTSGVIVRASDSELQTRQNTDNGKTGLLSALKGKLSKKKSVSDNADNSAAERGIQTDAESNAAVLQGGNTQTEVKRGSAMRLGQKRAEFNGIGYMLQRDQLFEWRTIEQNVRLGLEIQKKVTHENLKAANDLLTKYGLWEFRKHHPQELSGGMRQRAALIRTLATNPDLLLLDEPFSALDFQTRLEVCDDVYSIIKREKKTALLVTHDISEAISLADKVIVLTKRPATVKAIHETHMENIDTPLKRRQSPEFSAQFELLHEYLHG